MQYADLIAVNADENYLLVCEYGDGGVDAEIVVYKRRKNWIRT